MGVGSSTDTKKRVEKTRNEGVKAVEQIETYFLDPKFCAQLAIVETKSMSQLSALEDDELKQIGIKLGYRVNENEDDGSSRAAICSSIRRHWCARRRMVFQSLKMLEDFDRRLNDVLKGGYCFDDGGLLPRPLEIAFESDKTLEEELENPEGCMPNVAWTSLTAADQGYKSNRIRQDMCVGKWKEPIDDTWVRDASENKVYASAVKTLMSRFANAARRIEGLVTKLCVMKPFTPAEMTLIMTKLKNVKEELDLCIADFVRTVENLKPLTPLEVDHIAQERKRQANFIKQAFRTQRMQRKKLEQLDAEQLLREAKLVRSNAAGSP